MGEGERSLPSRHEPDGTRSGVAKMAGMARPDKLPSTRGWKSRQGRPEGRPVADPGAREKSLVLSGATKASGNGGSKCAGRNESEPPMTPRHIIIRKEFEAAEPSMSRRRQQTVATRHRTPPGYRGRHARTADGGTGETLPSSLEGQEGAYKATLKSHSAGRESDEVIVPMNARTNNLAEGRISTLVEGGEPGECGSCLKWTSRNRSVGRSPRPRNCVQGQVVWLNLLFRRSSVSRMPETGMYGLKGRGW